MTKIVNGKEVIDEKCRCGHLRSKHNDTLAIGHGNCIICDCEKFTWTEFVFGKKG